MDEGFQALSDYLLKKHNKYKKIIKQSRSSAPCSGGMDLRDEVAGTEGTIWCRWSAADARSDRPSFDLRYGLGDQVESVELEKPAGELLELADEITAVASCVQDGTAPPCTGADGRWSALLCLVAEASIEQNAVVRVDEYVRTHS